MNRHFLAMTMGVAIMKQRGVDVGANERLQLTILMFAESTCKGIIRQTTFGNFQAGPGNQVILIRNWKEILECRKVQIVAPFNPHYFKFAESRSQMLHYISILTVGLMIAYYSSSGSNSVLSYIRSQNCPTDYQRLAQRIVSAKVSSSPSHRSHRPEAFA